MGNKKGGLRTNRWSCERMESEKDALLVHSSATEGRRKWQMLRTDEESAKALSIQLPEPSFQRWH